MGELKASEHISVGRMSLYNGDITIVASPEAPVSIGSFCAIGKNLKIMPLNHDWNYLAIQGTFYRRYFNSMHPGEVGTPTRERTKGGVTIGNDVWIGDDVKILSGVSIGDGCCIGAGSIVTRSVAPYTIAAGVPCEPIKPRFPPEVASFLQDLRWWDWADDKIERNRLLFQSNISEMSRAQIIEILAD